jgi:hypothetical protein
VSKPRPSICAEIGELKDKSGSYLKTLCMVSSGVSYDVANTQCLAAGMKLFVVNSAAVQEALLQYSENYFASYGGPSLWINGKKDAANMWSSYNPTQALFSGMKWYGGAPAQTGNCLVVAARAPNVPFYVEPYNCEGGHWFYCEY